MQVTETTNEGLAREFKIVVPADAIEAKVAAKLDEIKGQVNIPGFRPGKIPASLLRQRYSKAVLGEVLEAAVNESSAEVLNTRELRPALQPKIEITSFDEGKDLEYDMKVELFPEFEPMDFAALSLTREVAEIDEEKIDEALGRLAEARGTNEKLKRKRKARKGDIALIDFVGKIDGEPFEGGAAEDYELELGSEQFIPGFEDQLIGVTPSEDTVVVTVSFPEEYGAKELAGKEAEFDVVLKELRERKPAEIDDELAKQLGKDDLEALKAAIREDYQREYANLSRQKLKRTLLDALADGHDFALPPTLVANELDGIIEQIKHAREHGHEDEDTKGKSEEELRAEFAAIAERRVRLGLLLAEVGRRNDIQITQEDLNRVMATEASRYPGQEQMVIDYYKNNPQALQALQGPIYEDKVVDFIIELAKIEETTVSVDELVKVEEDDEAAA